MIVSSFDNKRSTTNMLQSLVWSLMLSTCRHCAIQLRRPKPTGSNYSLKIELVSWRIQAHKRRLKPVLAYHCTIALLATWNAFFLGSAAIPVDAGIHLDRAIQLVNQKLDGPQALSDSSLSVVNFLIVQGLLQEVHSVVETHSKGLQQMIELRGGLSRLEENKLLLLKICKCVTFLK